MSMREIITKTTFATPGNARNNEFTTIFIPALREIIRKGRKQRIARRALIPPTEVDPASILSINPARLYLKKKVSTRERRTTVRTRTSVAVWTRTSRV